MHWTVHVDGGPRRVNHAAVVVKDKIYSFGGYCTGEDYRSTRPIDVHILDTCIYQWKELAPPNCSDVHFLKPNPQPARCGVPFRRYGHSAVAYGDKVYIWGGRNDEESCNTLFCFDTDTYSWEAPAVHGQKPPQRDGHSACLIDDDMYIFGGYEDGLGRFSQDTFALNLKTMTWRCVLTRGHKPSPRDFHTATAIGNRMYIFGGRGGPDPNHSLNETYDKNLMFLDTHSSVWHTVKPQHSHDHCSTNSTPYGRRSLSAFVYKGNLYIFGGYNGIMDRHFNDIHMFNTDTRMWHEIVTYGHQPSKRRRQQSILVDDRLFVFGGTSPADEDGPLPETQSTEDDPRLIDHSDLHVLDFAPSLQVLCLLVMIDKNLHQPQWLPRNIKSELKKMAVSGNVTTALNSLDGGIKTA